MNIIVVLALLLAVAHADIDWAKQQRMRSIVSINTNRTGNEWNKIMPNQRTKAGEQILYKGSHPHFKSSEVSRQPRIINGLEASRGQIPWQTIVIADSSASLCGGSLISKEWVLTAAQCVVPYTTFTIVLGATERGSQPGTVTEVTRRKVPHPDYDSETLKNDIALLRLPLAIQSNTYMNAVRLPRASQSSNTFENSIVRVSGFGKSNGNSIEMSPNLNYVDMSVISNGQCSSYFGERINVEKMCTKGMNGQTACTGDVGGPLTIHENDGRHTLIGVLSFTTEECQPSDPSAYTRVTSYLDWISSITNIPIRD